MGNLKMLMIVGMMSVALAACGGENGGANETNASVSASEAQKGGLSTADNKDSGSVENSTENSTEDNKEDNAEDNTAQTAGADLGAVADELLENAGFADELNQADAATVEKLYGISGAKEAVVYISSGATAEEVALFSFETEQEAKQAEELAKARIAEQRESFESYVPEEVKKLDNAVIRRSGSRLAVCVADGDAAEKILSKYF